MYAAHHPGPHRIQDNVAGQFKQVGVAVNQESLAAPLEDMDHAPSARVELQRLDAVELAHTTCQIDVCRLDQQMVVIAHQAIGVTDPVALFANPALQGKKPRAIRIILIDRLAPITTRRHVIRRTRKFQPQQSRHAALPWQPMPSHYRMVASTGKKQDLTLSLIGELTSSDPASSVPHALPSQVNHSQVI